MEGLFYLWKEWAGETNLRLLQMDICDWSTRVFHYISSYTYMSSFKALSTVAAEALDSLQQQ